MMARRILLHIMLISFYNYHKFTFQRMCTYIQGWNSDMRHATYRKSWDCVQSKDHCCFLNFHNSIFEQGGFVSLDEYFGICTNTKIVRRAISSILLPDRASNFKKKFAKLQMCFMMNSITLLLELSHPHIQSDFFPHSNTKKLGGGTHLSTFQVVFDSITRTNLWCCRSALNEHIFLSKADITHCCWQTGLKRNQVNFTSFGLFFCAIHILQQPYW